MGYFANPVDASLVPGYKDVVSVQQKGYLPGASSIFLVRCEQKQKVLIGSLGSLFWAGAQLPRRSAFGMPLPCGDFVKTKSWIYEMGEA